MSDTQQLFILAGVWTIISLFLARLVPSWVGRIVFFTALVGIPFWELPYGYYNFYKLCKWEAKLLVYEKFPPQVSICIDDLYTDVYAILARLEFTRIEVSGKTNLRESAIANGKLVRVKRGEESSAYCFATVSNIQLPWGILRFDSLVNRASDNRVIARQSGFSWVGMWWQKVLRPIFGHGGHCGAPLENVFLALRTGVR
ncbi:MAG: hypothetical protein IT513_14700 [Burkholderiales bacterium]|nr:hypothetical protein [Burkholderiales bacterium]